MFGTDLIVKIFTFQNNILQVYFTLTGVETHKYFALKEELKTRSIQMVSCCVL